VFTGHLTPHSFSLSPRPPHLLPSLLTHSFSFFLPFLPLTQLLPPVLILCTMPTTCAGSQKNGDSCDCTLFVPKSNGKRCKSCGHRRVSHSNIPTPPSQDANTNITVAPRQEPSKYVNRLFRSLEATAVHENARRETLQGFRPQPSSAIVCIHNVSRVTFTNLPYYPLSPFHHLRRGRERGHGCLVGSSPRA